MRQLSSSLPRRVVQAPSERGDPPGENETSHRGLGVVPGGPQGFGGSARVLAREAKGVCARREAGGRSLSRPVLLQDDAVTVTGFGCKRRKTREPAAKEAAGGERGRSPRVHTPFMVSRTKQDSSWKFWII